MATLIALPGDSSNPRSNKTPAKGLPFSPVSGAIIGWQVSAIGAIETTDVTNEIGDITGQVPIASRRVMLSLQGVP